jgi:pyruvate dehydrogenase E1 component beta subunit
MATVTLGKALNAGLRKAMENDPKVVIMGEDVGRLGGVFRVTDQLQKDFGEDRVIDTPLAESGIVGTAIGMSIRGFRPICEIQFDGFVFPAFDQIVSQVAKMHYRSAGNVTLPITIRIPYGGGIGAVEHHSESPESYFAHTPGLKVVSCSNPLDAYTMIQHAVASNDPIVFFEPKRRYWDKADVDLSAVDIGDPADLWDARVVREGTDATLITYGPSVRTCLEAAAAAATDGRDIEVLDLRALSPIDWPTVVDSVTKTQHAVVVSEAPVFGSLAAEVAARVSEKCFYSLEAPVLRVGGWSTPYPTARVEEDYLPDLDRILDAVDRSLAY